MQLAAINRMKIKTKTKKLIVSEDRWLQMSSRLLPRTQTVFVSTHGSGSVYVGFYCPEHNAFSLHMSIELLPFHSPSERFTCVARGFVTSIPAFPLLDGPVHYLFFFCGALQRFRFRNNTVIRGEKAAFTGLGRLIIPNGSSKNNRDVTTGPRSTARDNCFK